MNKQRKWFVLEDIMDQTKLDYFRIKEIFEQLRRDGFFQYIEEERKDIIWVQKSIKNFDIQPLVDLFEKHRTEKLKKVDLLIDCLRNKKCKRKELILYFGERYKPDNCGMCSHCKPKEGISNIVPTIDKNYAADEEIEKVKDLFKIKNEDNIKNKLIKLVALYTIPSKDFIKLVRGELHHFASRRIKDLPCCGMLKGGNRRDYI